MSKDYKNKADFLTVYIKEAHAQDDWHMDEVVDYNQPISIEERKQATNKLIDLYNPTMPIVMDTMKDDLEKAYKAWPERLYIIKDGKLQYVGGVGPFDYKIEEVE